MKSLKIKIKPDWNQRLIIDTLSNEHRLLYNYLLVEMKEHNLTFDELNERYKDYRNDNELTIQSKPAQNTCRTLINSIKSFYVKHRKDKTAKFPYKFKGWKYFCSFQLDWNKGRGGFKIDDNILVIALLSKSYKAKKLIIKLPEICKLITEDNIKAITFSKDNYIEDYYISFTYSENKNSNIELNEDNLLSIDLGYTDIVTCFSNKIENFSVENLRQKQLQSEIETVQSIKDTILSKYANLQNIDEKNKIKTKKGKAYKKWNKIYKRLKGKQSNKQKDFHHKLSRFIVDKCKGNDIGALIVGDLKVKEVINKENHKINGLSKSTSNIGRFKTFLQYKAKNEGMDFYQPSEMNTTKRNCLTDIIEFNSSVSNREFNLTESVKIDRDLNSAINIAKQTIMGECLTQDLILSKLELNKMYYNVRNSILCTKETSGNFIELFI